MSRTIRLGAFSTVEVDNRAKSAEQMIIDNGTLDYVVERRCVATVIINEGRLTILLEKSE